MKSKILFVYALLSFAVGCEKDCGPFPDKFNVKGINFNGYKIYHYDSTSFEIGWLDTSSSIYSDSLALGIFSIFDKYYSQSNWFYNLLSVKSAYACSPPILTSDEVIERIYITSNSDWNEEYLAGDTLNSIIELFFYSYYDSAIQTLPIDLNKYISQQPTAKQDYFLRFKTSPVSESRHKFTIFYKQTNGEIYTAESLTILIKP